MKKIIAENRNENKALTAAQLAEKAGYTKEMIKGYKNAVEELRNAVDKYATNKEMEQKIPLETAAIAELENVFVRYYDYDIKSFANPLYTLELFVRILHNFGKLRNVNQNGAMHKAKDLDNSYYGFNLQSAGTFRKSCEKFYLYCTDEINSPTVEEIKSWKEAIKKRNKKLKKEAAEKAKKEAAAAEKAKAEAAAAEKAKKEAAAAEKAKKEAAAAEKAKKEADEKEKTKKTA